MYLIHFFLPFFIIIYLFFIINYKKNYYYYYYYLETVKHFWQDAANVNCELERVYMV